MRRVTCDGCGGFIEDVGKAYHLDNLYRDRERMTVGWKHRHFHNAHCILAWATKRIDAGDTDDVPARRRSFWERVVG